MANVKSRVRENPATKPKADASAKPQGPIGREAVLDAAIHQFSIAGYDGTTMREIASVSGMLVGSIYYYFSSKEQLFLAAHEHAIEHICAAVRKSIDPAADPWTRLTQAAQGYLESMLNDYEYASIIISEFPRRRADELRDVLISHRQRFEDLFADIISEIPLRKGVDRSYFRLAVLGMLAWTYTWYNPKGRDSPRVIAKKMVSMLREANS
ncbi:TetR/AcrR family transcriptional regulator [Variovorax sp. WS11]|uniref:TetR/AcrR family transcriptional regulator n=1 Tax=Variovorax sp. WS11 TaxID=1105204 RepID=UPI000D0CB0B4|nr:TetR/AcrR family transcriptional regulator [Variovorax sp. WS11]NDZ17550.1 TetR/AcrR family transcriptional regulator [Variovorax sp. WS11]PSL82244.1 TetR/AcrR family transcriptional regulator [Variovorax sp. WS11]